MSIYRGPGGAGNATTDSEITLLTQLEQSASTSAANAATSATNAASSASSASTSATNAANSASSASTSASNAAGSATAAASSATAASNSASSASTSATNAANSATAAGTSATNAASSATAASGSASSASTSATNAANSASAAATSETNAASSASSASTSASNAATSATNASNSASSASTSATNASNSASAAATSASNAATSETNAAASASAALTSENNAATSEANAATSESNAATSESNAASSASAAATSASNAATSETNAANSASAASTSASNASSSASAAATSASNAATSESNAANSASDAADSASEAAGYAASINPSLYLTKADNLSGLANTATARTNLGVAIGTDVQAYSANLAGYAATGIGFRNRIINGDMRIDQRNNGAALTATGYSVDRWQVFKNTVSWSVQQVADAPAGFVNSLRVTTTTASAGSVALVQQWFEGNNVADLGFGTASASTVTVSFWVKSSVTGTFAVNFANGATNRSYVATYTVNSANTWEYKTITIPGDTTGTWATNNTAGLRVLFNIGTGGSATTAGSWQAGDLIRTSGSVGIEGTLNATWQITGVQLEAGSVATPFERVPYGTQLALCQRYAEVINLHLVSHLLTLNNFQYAHIFFKQTKRAAPTYSLLSGFWQGGTPIATAINTQMVRLEVTSSTAFFSNGDANILINSEL